MAPYFFLLNSIGPSTLHSGHIKIEVKNGVSNLQYSPQTCLVIRIYHFFTCTCKCTFFIQIYIYSRFSFCSVFVEWKACSALKKHITKQLFQGFQWKLASGKFHHLLPKSLPATFYIKFHLSCYFCYLINI